MQNKKNDFFILNMFEKVSRGESTSFLTKAEYQRVVSFLHKEKKSYQIFIPFPECEKKILYKDIFPKVKLYKIISSFPLKHSDILGALSSLQIDFHLFGDIIMREDSYIYLLEEMEPYIVNTLSYIGKNKVKWEEVELDVLKEYQREYEEYTYSVASTRIDLVFSKITHINRSKIDTYLHQKEIVINEEFINKSSYLLKEGDIFSIRKYGKYKVDKIEETKSSKRITLKKYK